MFEVPVEIGDTKQIDRVFEIRGQINRIPLAVLRLVCQVGSLRMRRLLRVDMSPYSLWLKISPDIPQKGVRVIFFTLYIDDLSTHLIGP